MKPAACVADRHTCPMVTGIVPHVGGPILPPGKATVLIGGNPPFALLTLPSIAALLWWGIRQC